jgi:hypothetical protein
MADKTKASVPEVKEYFGSVTAKDLIALKKAPGAEGSGNATAYDDLAFGIGDGTLTY